MGRQGEKVGEWSMWSVTILVILYSSVAAMQEFDLLLCFLIYVFTCCMYIVCIKYYIKLCYNY